MPVMVRVLEKSTVSDKVKKILKASSEELTKKYGCIFNVVNVWYNEHTEWCTAELISDSCSYHFEHRSNGKIDIKRSI